jgi:hypothetical protein
MPSGRLETDSLGHVRRERLDRYIPFRHTPTDAVAVELADIQEACCNPRAQQWYPHRCLCDLEECLCSSRKFGLSHPTSVLRVTEPLHQEDVITSSN